jgi:Cu+-exporting ATPase
MERRKFIQKVTCGLAAMETATAAVHETATYQITGFTCVTCAVGLDTMLRDQKGVIKSKSSYPDKTAVIEFDSNVITETQIKTFIEELGFKAR